MKNDFLTLIMTRRSIRAYKPDAVPADTLARVLEAGTYAPSAMGKQSATIVAVETKAYRDRLTKLNAAVIGKDVDPYYGAPVIVVVLGDGESANYLADGSCVLENLMLAAHAEGLGTVWVNREREICRKKRPVSVDVDDRLGQLRGGHVGVVIVLAAVGDPADRDCLPRAVLQTAQALDAAAADDGAAALDADVAARAEPSAASRCAAAARCTCTGATRPSSSAGG